MIPLSIMKKKSSSTASNTSNPRRGAGGNRQSRKDPFAVPPNPLGYNFLDERPRLRATQFGSILPSVIAKYGVGRRLGVERFHEAWQAAVEAVFGADDEFGYDDGFDDETPGRLETLRKHTRPASFRGGVLRVEVVSNLLANELQFQIPQLLSEMRRRLPNEKIDQIRIVVH